MLGEEGFSGARPEVISNFWSNRGVFWSATGTNASEAMGGKLLLHPLILLSVYENPII